MLNTKQIILISSVVILMGILLSLDIKGLVKPKEARNVESSTGTGQAGTTVDVNSASATAKEGLNASLAADITALEQQLKTLSGADKLAVQKQLAQKWDDVNKPNAAAFYYEDIALAENTASNWLIAGDRFTDAYQNNADSLAQPALVQKAINAYQKVQGLDATNLDAKTGLGIAYVSGTPNPMQGISLLLEVVKQDPDNLKANTNLGLFSMKSGQYQKAVDRFLKVISQKPGAEAYFYLATSYENLQQKQEAIAAFTKSKELAADPGLTQFIDNKIKELSK